MAKKKTTGLEKGNKAAAIWCGVAAGVLLSSFIAVIVCALYKAPIPDDPAKPPTPYELGYEEASGMFTKIARGRDDVDSILSYEDTYFTLVDKNGKQQKINLDELNFSQNTYLMVYYKLDDCWETIEDKSIDRYPADSWRVYYDLKLDCMYCERHAYVDFFEVEDIKDNDSVTVFTKISGRMPDYCLMEDKPIIYLYPTEEMDISVKLGRPDLLTSTYPKYQNGWTVHASPNGNLYDYATGRNYYALYWEGVNDGEVSFGDGFVVAGADTAKFLEDKLAYLGLNEYETEEFITYWIAKLEANPYNLIRFRTTEEMNTHMPIEFSVQPDSLIRVMMDFKALPASIELPEQKLERGERKGFTVIEWGGSEVK